MKFQIVKRCFSEFLKKFMRFENVSSDFTEMPFRQLRILTAYRNDPYYAKSVPPGFPEDTLRSQSRPEIIFL